MCDFLPLLYHADVTTNSTHANITCVAGHRFPDGSTSKHLPCVDTMNGYPSELLDDCSRKHLVK